ncbi:MAG: response regulator [Spirochaetales bacterium]|nr:response regulator [Spirochaetales bacterium]
MKRSGWPFGFPRSLNLQARTFLRLVLLFVLPLAGIAVFLLMRQFQGLRDRILEEQLLLGRLLARELENQIKDQAALDRNNPLLRQQGFTYHPARLPLKRKIQPAENSPEWLLFSQTGLLEESHGPELLYILKKTENNYAFWLFDGTFLSDFLLKNAMIPPDQIVFLFNSDDSAAGSNMVQLDQTVPVEWQQAYLEVGSRDGFLQYIHDLKVNDTHYLALQLTLPGLPFRALFARPRSVVLGPLQTDIFWQSAFLLGIILLALLYSYYTAREQIEPLITIRGFLQAIAENNYSVVPRIRALDERRLIFKGLNALRLRLRRYHQLNIEEIVEQEHLLNAVVRSLGDPVLLIDPEGTVQLRNQAFGQTFETGEGEFTAARPGLLLKKLAGIFLSESSRTSIPLSLRVASGEERAFEIAIMPWHNQGLVAGWILYFHDLTDELRTIQNLYSQREEALRMAEFRAAFLATMSHEIRTPLNAVLATADLLAETRLDQKQQQMLDIFHNAGRSLLSIINQILDLSRMEAGKFSLSRRPFQPAQLARDVTALLSNLAAPGVGLRHSLRRLPEWLNGDEDKIRQICVNLTGNALKFTTQGIVELRLSALQSRDGLRLFVAVRDSGPGIPRSRAAEIFQPFEQGNRPGHGGTGLGLAITRKLVGLMGGRIRVFSAEGCGSIFGATLKLEVARAIDTTEVRQTTETIESVRPLTALRILLVDDNPSNRILFQALLQSEPGVKITEAKDGREALELYRPGSFDLVFMDIQMPELDGMAATRLLREKEQSAVTDPVQIVALTAYSSAEQIQECLNAGCNAYLAKPFKKKDLISVLRQCEATVRLRE